MVQLAQPEDETVHQPVSPISKKLLQQSKIKAELLGLQETDIVLDQAVYAKAFELLQMPSHQSLKDFVVLRLGAFHTTCTFLAIIGKRFGDAGLRDIIVEANLLGEKKEITYLP